jgi:hypothetical protein
MFEKPRGLISPACKSEFFGFFEIKDVAEDDDMYKSAGIFTYFVG